MSFSENKHQVFMARALQLAELGRGAVAPNPMVGCVVVYQNKIIGEGYHQQYGQSHAEVNAIATVADKTLLSSATVYVTLEPCSHTGKTPPCADLLIKYKIFKIIIACTDPNPLVAGKGIEKLKNAGINVVVGVLEQEAKQLNIRFFKFITQQRPYILLKWAESANGFMATPDGVPVAISHSFANKMVHKWRAEECAILVGTQTALNDNPQLNTRNWIGKNPIRVLIDKHLKVPNAFKFFDNSQPTIIYNEQKKMQIQATKWVKIPQTNQLEWILTDLYTRKIDSLIVEGGSTLLNSFIAQNLWDEMRVITSPTSLPNGKSSPNIKHLTPFYIANLSPDNVKIYGMLKDNFPE